MKKIIVVILVILILLSGFYIVSNTPNYKAMTVTKEYIEAEINGGYTKDLFVIEGYANKSLHSRFRYYIATYSLKKVYGNSLGSNIVSYEYLGVKHIRKTGVIVTAIRIKGINQKKHIVYLWIEDGLILNIYLNKEKAFR